MAQSSSSSAPQQQQQQQQHHPHSQPTFDQAYGHSSVKGSWLARVSHRASHIPHRPSFSRDNLPLRVPASAGLQPAPEGSALAFLHKRNSSLPASPTETEFTSTPIDASFGDRLEPPARPATTTGTTPTITATARRTRSGTATQADQSRKEGKMDKYTRPAGDESYDSDGEADDEFERSVFTSPTLPTSYDDDQSDHPSESEEEPSLDGEDTPTTQAWTDREGRSPTGIIKHWSQELVADYLGALSPALKQYSATFEENGVNGEALVALNHDDLKELGVHSVGHRLTILKAVFDQKRRSGIKIEEGDYIPLSAESDRTDLNATQDDISRVIESIRLRDQRIITAEAELRTLRHELDRVSDENKRLREELLPVVRMMKDQRTPLPDPSGGQLPSPRDPEPAKQDPKASSLSRKFSTKKLFLGSTPKPTSPTHPPVSYTPQPREVRDDAGGHLEASAAAMAASNHLTASMTSQASPNGSHGQQLSPTSPAYAQTSASGNSFHPPVSNTSRSFPRDGTQSARPEQTRFAQNSNNDDPPTTYASSPWHDQPPATARLQGERSIPRRQVPTPSPREDEQQIPQSAPLPRDKERTGDRDNPQVEIFKSFRVSIEDPCRVVLPVALKRYNIMDDWRQYALYIVHGDQERCLGLEEKPLMLFKQLDKEGRKPMFMLRRHASPQEGWSGVAGSAALSHHSEGPKIPGGVL